MSAIRLALIGAASSVALAGAAMAAGVAVPVDDVTLVAFKAPVSIVYVGNPVIAGLTMIDSRHAFVLGKTFGNTNLIALGADQSVVVNEPITVVNRRAGAVTLNLGADAYTYSCTNQRCETNPLPGDKKEYFDTTSTEVSAHEDAGIKAASTAAPQSQMH